jgi:hypothetical protein
MRSKINNSVFPRDLTLTTSRKFKCTFPLLFLLTNCHVNNAFTHCYTLLHTLLHTLFTHTHSDFFFLQAHQQTRIIFSLNVCSIQTRREGFLPGTKKFNIKINQKALTYCIPLIIIQYTNTHYLYHLFVP